VSTQLDERACFDALARGGRQAERATGWLYDAYGDRFMAFMRMRGVDTATAEEIVQELFMKLFENRAQLPAVESPRAYLWRMLRNALTDHHRSTGRDRRVFADVTDGSDDPEDGFDHWLTRVVGSDGLDAEREDLVRCIARAIEALRREAPERALAIDLVAIEGFTGPQLAEALGRTHGAARQFLSESRKVLEDIARRTCGALLP
jgi:RNA polymerase sigma factor (sigma-70 family)